MLLPHILDGEGDLVYALLSCCWPWRSPSGRSERHISPLAGMSSQVLRRSFADTVMGSRYFILLSCDTAAPFTATSAPQPFDSRLDRNLFSQHSQKAGQLADHHVVL